MVIDAIMRRYHFHIIDDVSVFDSHGTRLPTDRAARAYAEKVAMELSQSNLFNRKATAVRVTNDVGEVLFRVPFKRSV